MHTAILSRRSPPRPRIHSPSSFLRRIAVRLALVQALIFIGMLGLVAYFGHAAQTAVARQVTQGRVLGEIASLKDELTSKGLEHLPHTIDKRSRLWRGFEYRLTAPDGTHIAGGLPDIEMTPGWATIENSGSGEKHLILTFTEKLPGGTLLAVGQDLAVEAQQTTLLTNILVWCGAFGAALGFGVSCFFIANGWRRVSDLARAAREASTGRLDVRVATRTDGLRDDIDELGTTFNTMLSEISNLMSQVQQVSTAVAHDLRTPLTRVRQRIERLRRKAEGAPELAFAIDQVDADLEELSRTFDAMLRLAEIENTRTAVDTTINLGDIASRVAEAFRPEIEDAGSAFRAAIQETNTSGDEQLIAQAVSNLLDNALRHTPPGTAITIGTTQTATGPVLFVADSGPGIPANLRTAAIEGFQKLDPSRTRVGCGLGLAIVSAIAKRHGAELILSDAHPGLRVEIKFPATVSA